MNRKDKGSLAGCSVDQLRVLLSLATQAENGCQSLPSVAAAPLQWRPRLNALCESEKYSGDVLLDVACSQESDIETLIAIKQQSKDLHKQATSDLDRAACMVLYHAVIASALAFHGKWISSNQQEGAVLLYSDLAQALRKDPLAKVFRKAIEVNESRDDGHS